MFLNPSFPEIKNKMLETKLALFTQDIDHKSRGVTTRTLVATLVSTMG